MRKAAAAGVDQLRGGFIGEPKNRRTTRGIPGATEFVVFVDTGADGGMAGAAMAGGAARSVDGALSLQPYPATRKVRNPLRSIARQVNSVSRLVGTNLPKIVFDFHGHVDGRLAIKVTGACRARRRTGEDTRPR